jgi:hypothetical protein
MLKSATFLSLGTSDLPRKAFLLSLLVVVFLRGVIIGYRKTFPFPLLWSAWKTAKTPRGQPPGMNNTVAETSQRSFLKISGAVSR